uniref:C2H2-type domain-containing protein n=1 Tax=viral metagenome TaxID=1070528 RepID=A0A6C0KYH8_9ZZZZ
MATADNENVAKVALFYECKFCDYNTSKKYNYSKHCSTDKHQKQANGNGQTTNGNTNPCKSSSVTNSYVCNCGKEYKDRTGLWKHKKKCATFENKKVANIDNDLIIELVKQNQEFKQQIIELSKERTMIINNNNNTTNNNQKFNMNFFLNEQCKGALDIMDFVSSLKVQLSDLENTGNVGYVKGISDIFVRGLKELDVYKRPIHCSDLKREVMYVKDKDVWEKDEDKKKVKKVIQNIAHKNFKQINDWVQENPESKDIQTKKHDQYMKILIKCSGGVDYEEDDIFYNKIITNVAKEVQIDKT